MLTTMALLVGLVGANGLNEPTDMPAFMNDTPNITTLVTEPRPVRARRKIGILGEAGFNSLAGVGVNASFNLHPNWAVDSGLGVGSGGYRLGVRGRYHFMKTNVTPFVALGATMNFGTPRLEMNTATQGQYSVEVRPTPFAVATTGVSWINDSGFTLLAAVGWSQKLTNGSNTLVTADRPLSAELRQSMDIVYGSGPVASLAMGYTF